MALVLFMFSVPEEEVVAGTLVAEGAELAAAPAGAGDRAEAQAQVVAGARAAEAQVDVPEVVVDVPEARAVHAQAEEAHALAVFPRLTSTILTTSPGSLFRRFHPAWQITSKFSTHWPMALAAS